MAYPRASEAVRATAPSAAMTRREAHYVHELHAKEFIQYSLNMSHCNFCYKFHIETAARDARMPRSFSATGVDERQQCCTLHAVCIFHFMKINCRDIVRAIAGGSPDARAFPDSLAVPSRLTTMSPRPERTCVCSYTTSAWTTQQLKHTAGPICV